MNRFYVAPLEGITGYIFRNAVYDMFGEGIDKLYAPFVMPHIKIPMSHKDMEDLCPEHNTHGKLVPQILTNDPEGFKLVETALRDYGYHEINLNLGCPSKTVANKGRGSGMLKYTATLDDFLYKIYESAGGPISIKTRIGDSDPEEFYKILEIYNKYPIYELTIHPRVRTQAYHGTPYTEHYYYALMHSKNPVCYNGDVKTPWDVEVLLNKRLLIPSGDMGIDADRRDVMPTLGHDIMLGNEHAFMLGRGIVQNPGLIRELTTGQKTTNEELAAFLKRLKNDYSEVFFGETPVLFKLKEVWAYMRFLFPDKDKKIKKLLKSKTIEEYSIYEREVLLR